MTRRSPRALIDSASTLSTAPRRGARGPQRAKIAALALFGAVSLTACQWTSPMATQIDYAAADGVRVNLGALQLRDLLVVAPQKDGPGTVAALIYNGSDKDERVTIGAQGGQAPITVTVPAMGAINLAEGDARSQIPSVPVPPGALMEMSVASSAGTTVQQVPVLYPHTYYSSIKPTPMATTGATSGTSSAGPSATQTAPPQTESPTQAPAETAPTSTTTSQG